VIGPNSDEHDEVAAIRKRLMQSVFEVGHAQDTMRGPRIREGRERARRIGNELASGSGRTRQAWQVGYGVIVRIEQIGWVI